MMCIRSWCVRERLLVCYEYPAIMRNKSSMFVGDVGSHYVQCARRPLSITSALRSLEQSRAERSSVVGVFSQESSPPHQAMTLQCCDIIPCNQS